MTLNFKNLNVSSLDYSEIVESLKTFLSSEPSLSELDYDNPASSVNMLINILATATAYNGVYAQFGYRESFLSTSNLLESIVGHASNGSVLLEVKKSASCTRNVLVTGNTLESYTTFVGNAPDGSEVLFFNLEKISPNIPSQVTLISGISVKQYTDWDFNSQSMVLPTSVDPNSIKLYSVDTSGNIIEWQKIDKTSMTETTQYYYTVLNTVNGYLVTTNLPESFNLTTDYTVYTKAVLSNGYFGNQASIIPLSNTQFLTTATPSGGYSELTVDFAKSKVKFLANATNRCVTINDYILAILNSGISGTENIDDISVINGDQPGTIKIYVDGLESSSANNLITYLGSLSVAGTSLVYEQ